MASFDIVSKINQQEVKNAIDQVKREITTRYDFKDTDSIIELKGQNEIFIESATHERLNALFQVLQEKLIKRSISLKVLDPKAIEDASKSRAKQTINLKSGIDKDTSKIIISKIKELGFKQLTTSFQSDLIRVTGKKRDELQSVISALKDSDLSIPLQFENFRE
jgi:uncharacterized protein YajQ (UPF0234 family)